MTTISRHFVTTSAWNLVARGTFLLSGFIAIVILARTLPPAVYGLYALTVVLVSYSVVLCDLGLSSGLLRLKADRGEAVQFSGRLLWYVVALQVGVAVVLAVGSTVARPLLERAYDVRFGPYLLCAVGIALLTVFRNDLQNLRVAAGRGAALATANLTFAALWVGGLLLVAHESSSLLSILVLQGAAVGTAVLILFVDTRRQLSAIPNAPLARGEAPVTAGLLIYSLAFVARGAVTLIVQKQSEVFFLGHYIDLAAVGYYDAGYALAFFGLMSVHQAVYPVAVASLTRAARDGIEKLRRAVTVLYKFTFTHVVPIAVIGCVLGDKGVDILYGPRMAPAGPIAQAFFVINLLPLLTSGVAVGMLALGRPWAGMHLSVASATLNIALAALLIPRFGVPGAIATVIVTGIVSNTAFLFFYRRHLGAGLLPWGYLARCGMAAAPILLLVPLRPYVTGLPSLLLAGIVAGILYLLGARLTRLVAGEEQRMLLSSGLAGARYLARLLGAPPR